MRMICIISPFQAERQHTIGTIPMWPLPRTFPRFAPLVLICALLPLWAAADTGRAQAGQFDYYLLSLSWSPTYCNLKPDDRSQCGNRRFGFILHGLWPQYRGGGYPQNCGDSRVPRPVLNRALAFMPSPQLIRHEWRSHGSCSGLSVQEYFLAAEQAYGAVRIPALFSQEPIPQHLTAPAVIQAFIAANPGLDERRIVLQCRGPELEEVRICLDKSLAPSRCGQKVRTHCRQGPLQIRPVR
jgi:ribonuclease T2